MLIKSEKNGLYVGFNGVPRHGAEIITVSRQDAKVWNIELSDEEYQCDHPVLSSYLLISSTWSDRVILRDDVSWLIEFDKEKMYTGMHAHLARAIPGANQLWTIAMRESCSRAFSCFILNSFPRLAT